MRTEERINGAIEAATAARRRSYSPYSGFKMGAAIVDANGTIVTGTLVENVSLGLAMCSERAALFAAVDADLTPEVLAVSSPRTDEALTLPCGACRQVALEIAGPDLLVVAVDPEGTFETRHLHELLPDAPHRFTPATRPE